MTTIKELAEWLRAAPLWLDDRFKETADLIESIPALQSRVKELEEDIKKILDPVDREFYFNRKESKRNEILQSQLALLTSEREKVVERLEKVKHEMFNGEPILELIDALLADLRAEKGEG